jgi:peptidoglycan hydrolase-like protein with peptidoglycan-binding domain
VRDDVIAATGNEQQPFVYGSLSKEAIYLKPLRAVASPTAPDQIAWSMLKKTTDEAALRRFTTQYPDSPLLKNAETRIAALQAVQAAKVTPANPIDPHELARSLQFELTRVGCFNGAVNGEFDDATRAASRTFAKLTSIKMPDDLSPDSIKAVRGIRSSARAYP